MTKFEDFEEKWCSNRLDLSTVMLCFYTGKAAPRFCAAMPRVPAAPVNTTFNAAFLEHYESAISINSAIHDGAVLVGRAQTSDQYLIRSWSVRLYPPPASSNLEPNRGSAFNSCLEMSCVPSVDRLYLLSGRQLTRFMNGVWKTIEGNY